MQMGLLRTSLRRAAVRFTISYTPVIVFIYDINIDGLWEFVSVRLK